MVLREGVSTGMCRCEGRKEVCVCVCPGERVGGPAGQLLNECVSEAITLRTCSRRTRGS